MTRDPRRKVQLMNVRGVMCEQANPVDCANSVMFPVNETTWYVNTTLLYCTNTYSK